MDNNSYYCERCQKTLSGANFYSSNNLEKYPNNGKLHLCKKCLTAHIDNFNPDTYLWILKEIDVPYVPKEWEELIIKYRKDNKKLTSSAILGRYLSKMKLNQYNKFRWEDTNFLQDREKARAEEAMRNQGYSTSEIISQLDKMPSGIEEEKVRVPDPVELEPPVEETEDYFAEQSPVPEIKIDLSEEDMTYLCLKWGKSYKPEEWVKLEQLYEDMMSSYDIQAAGHLDTLKLICKTSLKANQLLDIGDVDGAQKMVKMYDGLMKSGKFTAAQNKAESGEYIDSIAELVAICETDGFIPRYYTDGPQDKVDRVLQDLQTYTRSLVTEEMGLGNLIEQAVKQIEIDKEKEAQENTDDEDELIESRLFDDNVVITSDQDFVEFSEFEEQLEEDDKEFFDKIAEGEI